MEHVSRGTGTVKEERLPRALQGAAEWRVPAEADLWPAIRAQLPAPRRSTPSYTRRLLIAACSLMLITAVGLGYRAWQHETYGTPGDPAATAAITAIPTPIPGWRMWAETPTITPTPAGSPLVRVDSPTQARAGQSGGPVWVSEAPTPSRHTHEPGLLSPLPTVTGPAG